jgi:tetratricopeptide (TPR) repeat protein
MRDILRAASDDYGLSLSYMAEGAIEELEGRNASAADAFANALEYARHAGDRRAEAESVGRLLLNIILGETPVPTGIDRCEQLLTEWADQPRVLASMMDSYALLLAMAGRSTDALAAARQALTIVTELDDGLNEGLYRGQTLGVLLALAGDLPGAATEATRGCDLLITFGARAWLASAACVAGEAELAQGHVELAERWLNESNESSLASDIDAHARSAALGARLAVHHGDLAQAEHLIVAARDLVDGTELLYLRGIVAAATGCVRWAAGDTQGAVEFMREAAALHDQKGDVARARRARLLEDEPARAHQMSLA